MPRAAIVGAVAFLAAAPAVAVAHAALILAGAALLGGLERYGADLLPLLPIDPVYGGAALHVLGGIRGHGLAVAGPIGAALHEVWPALFVSSEVAVAGTAVTAILEPGATVVARTLAGLLATVALLVPAIGLSRRPAPRWALVAGSLFQAQLLGEQVLDSRLTLREIEATGLPFALAAFAPVGEAGQRPLFTRQLAGLSDATVGLVCGLLLAMAAHLLAAGVVGIVDVLARMRRSSDRRSSPERRLRGLRPAALRGAAGRGMAVAGLAVTLGGLPLGPIAGCGVGTPTAVAADELAASQVAPAGPLEEPTSQEPTSQGPAVTTGDVRIAAPSVPHAAPRVPSVVTLEGGNYRYVYRVDGVPTVIRGMGYNPWYAGLPPVERTRRYDRDFGAMARLGVNTVEGWFQDQFDALTLDAAHAHGLGVIMPFELNHDYDYADPRVRAAFVEEVTAWVLRHKDHPAVRMWGPGNELMHRLIYPTMVSGGPDPAREARADAFAAFYVELIDLIHALDPRHPVVYRDAEDHYLGRLREALRRDGKARPWFVYGANAYTPRLETVIERWPEQGLDAPLLISEFAPGGVAPAERPEKLGWYWSTIRERPEMVLGGVVYTWATDGPEDLDRIFGLTDADGRPVDGSLAALDRLFHPSTSAAD